MRTFSTPLPTCSGWPHSPPLRLTIPCQQSLVSRRSVMNLRSASFPDPGLRTSLHYYTIKMSEDSGTSDLPRDAGLRAPSSTLSTLSTRDKNKQGGSGVVNVKFRTVRSQLRRHLTTPDILAAMTGSFRRTPSTERCPSLPGPANRLTTRLSAACSAAHEPLLQLANLDKE